MTSSADIITRWVQEVRKDNPKYLRPSASNVQVYDLPGVKRAVLHSYGYHFELARWIDPTDDHSGYWLLNGDRYSNTTSGQQNQVRGAVRATGDPVLILPFTTLASAGIDLASIVPVEITQDRYAPRTYADKAALPERVRQSLDFYLSSDYCDWTANPDGSYTDARGTHLLGESLIRADYTTTRHGGNIHRYVDVTASALFLSGFDAQESRPHYFLAQLPDGTQASTVAEAFTALRPEAVRLADDNGVASTRQGDVFAVPVPSLTTRELSKRGERVRQGRLLGLSHVASEVVDAPDGTYARGTLTHRPTGSWRRAEHKRQRMADGKTWHLIVKNTVPMDDQNNSRAWSQAGNVD